MSGSDSTCGSKAGAERNAERRKLQERLALIRRKIVILSGKGGVGKSTVAVNLAVAAMMSGRRVGLLDADIHGPSLPTMLGLEGAKINGGDGNLLPVELGDLKVMSIGFLLGNPDEALIWRGPMKMGVIEQFLRDVDWGELDCLVVDLPPGTGDEALSACQLIGSPDGAVIVTTPQKVATVDVRKSVTFCRRLGVPVLGVIENMSGFACPECGVVTQVFSSGGGEALAAGMGVPFLGALPLDPAVTEAGDSGRVFIHHQAENPTAVAMRGIVASLAPWMGGETETEKAVDTAPSSAGQKEARQMKIAIPLAGGKLATHFGHCEQFVLVEVDRVAKKVLGREELTPPPHEPGRLPAWLAGLGAHLIIAGGMGQRAQNLFNEQGIGVVVGAPAEEPEKLVADYLADTLQPGKNVCDH